MSGYPLGADQLTLGDLPRVARVINLELLNAGFDPSTQDVRQMLALNEEVGEFTGAWRRYTGMARRTGHVDEVLEEWADVVITAYVTGDALGFSYSDMRAALEAKLQKVFTRGWRETSE